MSIHSFAQSYTHTHTHTQTDSELPPALDPSATTCTVTSLLLPVAFPAATLQKPAFRVAAVHLVPGATGFLEKAQGVRRSSPLRHVHRAAVAVVRIVALLHALAAADCQAELHADALEVLLLACHAVPAIVGV